MYLVMFSQRLFVDSDREMLLCLPLAMADAPKICLAQKQWMSLGRRELRMEFLLFVPSGRFLCLGLRGDPLVLKVQAFEGDLNLVF